MNNFTPPKPEPPTIEVIREDQTAPRDEFFLSPMPEGKPAESQFPFRKVWMAVFLLAFFLYLFFGMW